MSYPTTIASTQRNELLCQPYAAIDTEYRTRYNSPKPYTVYAVAIVDSLGNTKVKHEWDFANFQNPDKELAKWAMSEILNYRLTIGWYSKGVKTCNGEGGSTKGKDSDLKILDETCKFYNIPSIIGINRRGVPYIRGYNDIDKNRFGRYYHVDLYDVYKKTMVKNIYKNKYKSLRLDAVCQAIMGEGKFDKLDGQQIQALPKEKQLQYVCQDAELVMRLSKHNNYEVFDLIDAISTITNIPFDQVCHTSVSNWWATILYELVNNGKSRLPTLSSEERKNKKVYKGGHVIDPAVGYYSRQNVYVLDVKSLYPTMMINNNISFDTVNCPCCKDKPDALVPSEIMNTMEKDEEKEKTYWICKDPAYRGTIPRLLEQYRNERFRQQELGKNATQLALKNLINGCYGLFGSEFFEFADYRVAEITTAFGRKTLAYMKHTAEEVYGFRVIYGDTDSIFVTNVKEEAEINRFLAQCSLVLEDVEIELSSTYRKFLLLKKKHYIGIPLDKTKDSDIKGIEGTKSDRPQWINNLQNDFVEDLTHGRNPTIKLRKAYMDMERGQVAPELLAISTTLKKDPLSYSPNTYQRIVGKQLNSREGDSIKYYKANTRGTAHSNSAFIDIGKYLQMMQSTFEEQLKVLGYNFLTDVVGVKSLADL